MSRMHKYDLDFLNGYMPIIKSKNKFRTKKMQISYAIWYVKNSPFLC